jgi:predicted dehydrogenase
MTTTPIRIAVIGAGTISQSIHLPTLQRAGYEIVMICDLSPSRVKEVRARYGIPGTTSAAEVLANPDVEAVLIATPGSHARLALAAITAGKHVLAEKPLALTLGEIDELERAAEAADVVVQVGYMKMYDPLTARAKAELSELEDITLVRVTVAHPDDLPQVGHLRMSPPNPDADASEIDSAVAHEEEQSRRALPGASDALLRYYRDVLNGSVVHEFSLLRGLGLELPVEWSAEAFPTLDGPGPASLLATGAVGTARYVLSWNWLPEYPDYDEELKVLAANGRLEYHLAKPYLLEERSRLLVQRHAGSERRETTYTEGYETGFLGQLDAFAGSVRRGEPVLSDMAGARRDVACLQALAQAIGSVRGETVGTERG